MELKQQRYNVRWDCPYCGNSHNWWWEDEFEAHADDICDMICDRCMELSKCKGDGNGFYVPVEEKTEHERLTELEARIDAIHKQSFDAINRLSKRLLKLETSVSDYRGELDNLSRRTTQTELAVWRLENGIPSRSTLGPQHIELAKEMERGERYGYEHDENPIVPTKGDMRIDDADPTVMYIYDGTRWCRTY